MSLPGRTSNLFEAGTACRSRSWQTATRALKPKRASFLKQINGVQAVRSSPEFFNDFNGPGTKFRVRANATPKSAISVQRQLQRRVNPRFRLAYACPNTRRLVSVPHAFEDASILAPWPILDIASDPTSRLVDLLSKIFECNDIAGDRFKIPVNWDFAKLTILLACEGMS
jgi:hypothetical protein